MECVHGVNTPYPGTGLQTKINPANRKFNKFPCGRNNNIVADNGDFVTSRVRTGMERGSVADPPMQEQNQIKEGSDFVNSWTTNESGRVYPKFKRT